MLFVYSQDSVMKVSKMSDCGAFLLLCAKSKSVLHFTVKVYNTKVKKSM